MKQICHFERSVAMTANVRVLGEVAEPDAKLEHRTLKLRTND